MGGAHRLHKAPGPAGSTARIKAGPASSLFQAKCYKLLYSNSTVKLQSRENEKTKQNKQKTKIKPNKNSPHKTREHWKKTCLEQSISAAIVASGIFFSILSHCIVLYDQLQHNLETSYTSSLSYNTVAILTIPLLY